MANCTYTIKGRKFASYTELLGYIDELAQTGALELNGVDDIVYSKASKQSVQVQKLKALKANYTPRLNVEVTTSSLTDGEPGLKGATSIIDFLDSPACSLGERPLLTPLSREDYVKSQVEKLVKEEGMKEEDALKVVEDTISHWDKVQEDSFALHKLFTNNHIQNPDSTDIDFMTEVQDSLPDSLKGARLTTELFNQLKRFYISEKGKYSGSQAIKNVNLVSKIKGLDQEIVGHIDYLFVGEDGTLHLYLFKTTSTDPKSWPNIKEEKYKYQLAFLKQMLANNGVNVKNIDLNIVPVQLTYNDDFTKVQSINIHYPKPYSTRRSGSEYAMAKYDRQVKAFIEDNSIPFHISDKPIERADEVNKAIFPEINIRTEGIAQSARVWIRQAPNTDPTGTEQLVIKEVGEPDHAYDVIINGVTHPVKSAKSRNNNPEILELVTKYLNDLEDNKGYSTQRLKDAIENSYVKGFPTFETVPGLMSSATTLNAVLTKYFEYTEDEITKRKEYKWELMKDLIDSNVLIFRNKDDNTIDIITLTSFDLNTQAGFAKGTNILGHYRFDGQYVDLQGNYGNIEAVRTMELLNEILPQLGEVRLGTLGVLSSINGSSFRKFDIGQFNKNYFQEIIKVVNKENSGLNIENNFKAAKFVDPVESILNEYLRVVDSKDSSERARYDEYGFGQLSVQSSRDQQLKALQYIMTQILDTHKRFADPEYFEKTLATPGTSATKNMAILYDLVTKAYLNLSGEAPSYQTEWNPINMQMFTAATVPDPNVRIVVNNLQITHDTIASEFLGKFDKDIKKHFDKFYEAAGYSAAQNMVIGNQAQQYSNFFERDVMTGKNLMIFKNPYDNSNDLKPHERELLKQVLYQIAQINHNGNFSYSSPSDPKLPQYIKEHQEYLWVPLERASKATSRQSATAITTRMKNQWKRMLKAGETFDEFVNNLTQEERDLLGNDNDDFYKMTLRNPFELSIPSSNSGFAETYKSRQRLLEKYGPEYFETNVENILIDFLAKHISTTQLNKLLVGSKALLLQLHLTGNFAGNEAIVKKEIKYIQDYLKVNVFNTSIMSSAEKAIIGNIAPVKSLVTNMLLGGNVVSMFRDSIEGVQQNFMRSLIKLNTDIDPNSVRKAYQYVTTHATSNAMAVNLLSKLCLKYRLSNTDVGRIAERAKSSRNGIFNFDNWMYGTLRSPDFLNRMTLFVAKCMHDGVWDAYSIDKDNNLVYDWKKDKRFDVLATKQVNHPEYKKQKALYLSKIREYNIEHPESPIEPDGDLPTPYIDREIMSIRAVGDNIYGSYDRGKKAMAENTSLGIMFGMFTTWMNGIVNNYFMSPQKNNVSKLVQEQEINDQGEKLYFNEQGEVLTLEEGGDENLPVYKNVPMITQGIMYTVLDMARLCKSGGVRAALDYMQGNEVAKANMRKLISDLLMWALFAMLFKLALDPAYKEHKKTAADNPVVVNLVTEILYKSSSRAYDQYKGPMNVIQFFGENMNPPFYSTPVQVLSEAGQALVGQKSWKYLLFDNTGLTRSFKDTGFAYIKSQQE